MKNFILMSFLITSVSFTACSTSKAKTDSEAVKREASSAIADDREKMAGIHDRMATCLRGSGSIESCHEDMMKDCKEIMGKDGCKMGMKKKHHGEHKKK
jgi:hypothetical protein